jgi:hypothetical protein
MRAIGIALAMLGVCAIGACDINTGGSKSDKVACNCTAPPPAPPAAPPVVVPPEPRVHHVSHHDGWHDYAAHTGHGRAHAYYWRREYAEISVQTYDYRSDSHSYVMGESDAYAGGGAYGGGHHGGGHRGHGGEATTGEPAFFNPPPDDRARSSVWHGYDEDCPEDERR